MNLLLPCEGKSTSRRNLSRLRVDTGMAAGVGDGENRHAGNGEESGEDIFLR